MPLYVEARIRAGMDQLWEATQDPAQHRRWDLRFTHIDYLDQGVGGAQRFRYGVRVLGVMLSGTGVCAGERRGPDGSRTSALRFASPHPLSLLAEGSGYWRYIPTREGIRFLTGYGYRTQPGSTWVRSPGCYAWQVDGRGFSETIVVKAGAGLR